MKFRCQKGIASANGVQVFELDADDEAQALELFAAGGGELVDTECEIDDLEAYDLETIEEVTEDEVTTEQLINERSDNEQKIHDLKDDNRKLTYQMCEIEGPCPRCSNWHYPHC